MVFSINDMPNVTFCYIILPNGAVTALTNGISINDMPNVTFCYTCIILPNGVFSYWLAK